MGIIKTSVPGPTGWQNGCTMCGKPAREGLRSASLLTGDSTRPSPMPSSGQGGSGEDCRLGQGNSRPQKGRFRQQAEYIVWGSNGPMPINRPVSCLPGVFRYGNPQNRIHVTEKPLQLMKDVIQICEPGGLILDPFAGAGTTILAAAESGFQAVGIEVTDSYYKLGSDRVRIALEAGEEAENKEPQ